MKLATLTLILLSMLTLCGVSNMQAQTTYTQSTNARCTASQWVCNRNPLTGGGYFVFNGPGQKIEAGFNFSFVNWQGEVHNGTITGVTAQPPLQLTPGCLPETFCFSGPVEFTFSIDNGTVTGTVSGSAAIEKVCGRYCWPEAWMQSGTTVTIN